MLDFIELGLDMKHKIKIYISSTHKKQTTIYIVENRPNHLYCLDIRYALNHLIILASQTYRFHLK